MNTYYVERINCFSLVCIPSSPKHFLGIVKYSFAIQCRRKHHVDSPPFESRILFWSNWPLQASMWSLSEIYNCGLPLSTMALLVDVIDEIEVPFARITATSEDLMFIKLHIDYLGIFFWQITNTWKFVTSIRIVLCRCVGDALLQQSAW